MGPSPPPAVAPRHRWPLPLAIALLTVAVYLPSWRGEFVNFDDTTNFVFNTRYRGLGPEQLRWMFTDYYGHYIPLTWLSLGLDYVLWGMNPLGYHLTSTLLHGLNAFLLFLVIRLLLARARGDQTAGAAGAAAAAGALFFSLHPLRVESVAWISERRDVLSGAFFLLAIWAYLKSVDRPGEERARGRWRGLSIASFALMLLAKTSGMTLPLVLLVLDAYPLGRFRRERPWALLREKIPYAVLMVAGAAISSVAQNHAQAIYSSSQYPLVQSLAQPGYRISFYLLKTFCPTGLSPLYFYRPELGLSQGLGWLFVAALTGAALALRRIRPWVLAVWGSYLILLSPVSGVVQYGPHFAADRNTYLACLPLAVMVAGFSGALLVRAPLRGAGVTMIVLAALAAGTIRQSAVWRDSIALWNRAIEIEPDVYYSFGMRAQAFAARGEPARALEDATRSIAYNPGWFETWGTRARARLALNDPQGALADASRAVALDPLWAEGYDLRGQALVKTGRPREALEDFSRALERRPQYMDARMRRATERAKLGDLDGALADLDEAVRFDPQASVFVLRAMVRGMKGDLEGAAQDATAALREKPGYAEAYLHRGFARLSQGRRAEAAADLARARELLPPGSPLRPRADELLRQAGGTR